MTVQIIESDKTDNTTQCMRKEMGRNRSVLIGYLLKLNRCIDASHSDLAQAVAQRFNEELVDYISYGHFRLLESSNPQTHQLVAIEKSTQQALQFSDQYTTRLALPLAQLKQDLEALAFALEMRFDIEDEIVSAA
jgi:regulator of sigma D